VIEPLLPPAGPVAGGGMTVRFWRTSCSRSVPVCREGTSRSGGCRRDDQGRGLELLGLAPGSSASRRLAELTRGPLPDDAVRALVAATGMTPAQARALTASAADTAAGLEHPARQMLDEKLIQRGGEGKTRTDASSLARLLAEAGARLPRLVDTGRPRSLDDWAEPAARPVLVDLPWPAEGTTAPADPGLVDEILKELGIAPPPRPSSARRPRPARSGSRSASGCLAGAPHEAQQSGPRPAGELRRVGDMRVGGSGQGAAESEGGEDGLGRADGRRPKASGWRTALAAAAR
jgi:hypothetical protein